MDDAHRVVILGGGFGGLYAAKALKKAPVQVTLLDRRNFHLFQPLLYQVATGSLSPGEIASPLRSVLRRQKNTQVLLGEASDLDAERRRVILADGQALDYDSLIVATGSADSYFGHDDWRRNAPGLKSIEEATEIRHKILYAFEAAEREHDPEKRREWLTFVIVGAGPPASNSRAHWPRSRTILSGTIFDPSIRKMRASSCWKARRACCRTYPEDLSAKAEASLIKLSVTPQTGVFVTDIDENGVTVKTRAGVERIAARTVIWAAGVTSVSLWRCAGTSRRRAARQKRTRRCEWRLQRAGASRDFRHRRPRALRAGRKASARRRASGHAGGSLCCETDRARLRGETLPPFRYFNKGNLAVIGRACRRRRDRTAAHLWLARLAHLAVRPLDVSGGIFQSRSGVHPVGIPLFDVQSRRAADHRTRFRAYRHADCQASHNESPTHGSEVAVGIVFAILDCLADLATIPCSRSNPVTGPSQLTPRAFGPVYSGSLLCLRRARRHPISHWTLFENRGARFHHRLPGIAAAQ